MADLYRLLGLNRAASQSEIKSAYRRLARQYHPDVNPDPSAAREFAHLTEAYHILMDPSRRAEYDRTGQVHKRATTDRAAAYARKAYYQAKADRAVNEWLARERAEMRQRGHAVYTTVALFLSTFFVAILKPGIFEPSNPFWYVVLVVLFATSIWHLALSLKRHFDYYSYRQEMVSVMHATKPKKPFTRAMAWTFVLGGYVAAVALGLFIGALTKSFTKEFFGETNLIDGIFSVLFYPPIAVLIVDTMYLLNLRLEDL